MTNSQQPPAQQSAPRKKLARPPKSRVKEPLTEMQVAKLYIRTLCSQSTIRRWALGYTVNSSTLVRLGRAAAEMGIEVRE